MSKTAELRKLITAKLNTTQGGTYYRRAPKDAVMPYKVYDLARVDLTDSARDDYELTVDIWEKADNSRLVDEMADSIESLFNVANLPQSTILPTFFRSNRYPVADNDKDIQHLQLTFLIEMYENK